MGRIILKGRPGVDDHFELGGASCDVTNGGTRALTLLASGDGRLRVYDPSELRDPGLGDGYGPWWVPVPTAIAP